MEQEKQTVGSLAVKSAPRVITIAPTQTPETRRLRVAAYARVSSKSEDQLNSFAAQNAYYTKLITENPSWDFVEVYADEGITGTSMEKRDDFNRMIADCKRGRIDKILVKATSRFARNTKECLEVTRQLKEINVAVCFEEQNIDTSALSGELLIAIFASLAQKESESISENMRWSYQKRMKSGKFTTCKPPFGYQLDKRTLEINEEEAPIVRLIFDRYLSGSSMDDIAEEVTGFHIPTRDKKPVWRATTIRHILQNERYAGYSVLQKTYTTESLPRQKRKNRGEKEQYLVQNTNPPIITQETFSRAQSLLEKRGQAIMTGTGNSSCLIGMMRCGTCGSVLKRKKHLETVHWVCRKHDKSPKDCPLTQIPEEQVTGSFLRLYYKLQDHGIEALSQLMKDLQMARNGGLLWSLDIVEMNKKIAEITRQDQLLAELKKQGLVDPDIFISRSNALAEQLRQVKIDKERMLEAEEDSTIRKTQEILELLEAAPKFLSTFDEELFSGLVEKVIVVSTEQLRFRLINGLELTESIERTIR